MLSSCGYVLENSFIQAGISGWWNAGWSNRRALTFDNSGQFEDLTGFPVLIRLDNGRIDYNTTQDSGEDLRFVDSDGTVLPHEIEDWNESGDSYVWVKVPQIDGGSTSDFIWMYYGNSSAPDAQDVVNVWDGNYICVLHLNEPSGTFTDSTANLNDGTAQGTPVRVTGGPAAGAQDFDAGSDRVSITPAMGATVTISAWGKLDTQGDMLWCLDTAGGPDLFFTGGNIYLNTWDSSGNPFGPQPPSVNQWHHYAAVISPGTTELYIDGLSGGTATYRNPTETIIYIGSSDTGYTWNGSVDEFRISSTGRSSDWIKAQYDSMSDAFITFGSEQ